MTFVIRLTVGIVWLLSAAGLPLRTVHAQTGPRVVTMGVPEYVFGQAPTFTINLAADSPIVAVTLNLRTPDVAWTVSDTARFIAGTEVTATYTLQPSKRRLQPFSPVEYWWEARDEAGNFLETAHQTFRHLDNRFEWQSLSEERLTVWWYRGDRAYGRTALDIANNGLMQANRDIRAALPEKVDIYLYANETDAQLALSAANRLWADGHANPVFGTIVATVPPDDIETITRMGREIPHELTHILLYQAVGDADRFAALPAWLNEGLAVLNQSSPDAAAATTLAGAQANNQLQSLAALCAPFPADPAQAQLAYAQSESVVRYIRDRFGSRAISNMLQAYREGQACGSGVQTALGMSLADLEAQWLKDAVNGAAPASRAESALPLLVVGAIMIVVAPIVFSLVIQRPGRRAAPRVV
jgi:hypothetical protein